MPFFVHWILALCCASNVGAVTYMRAELKGPSTVRAVPCLFHPCPHLTAAL